MIEDPAVGGVGAAVDVEDSGVLLAGVEVWRKLDEGVDREEGDVVWADGGGDVELVRHVEVELGEESLVDVSDLGLIAGTGRGCAGMRTGGGAGGSMRKRSPMRMGLEMRATTVLLSGVATKPSTAC